MDPADKLNQGQPLVSGKLERFGECPTVALRKERDIMAVMNPEPEKPKGFATLYRRAFTDFGASAQWSSPPVPDPAPADSLAITRSLRAEGDLRARRLAEQIEQACRHAAR